MTPTSNKEESGTPTPKQKLMDKIFAGIENKPEPWHRSTIYVQDPDGTRHLLFDREFKGMEEDVTLIVSSDSSLRGGASIIEVIPAHLTQLHKDAFDEFERIY